MINPNFKAMLTQIDELVSNVLQKGGHDTQGVEIVKVGLSQFLMYLSASDGKIEWSEADNISQYLGLNITPEAVNQFIREQNIYSTKFEQTVPLAFQVLVEADNLLWDNGSRETCSADMLLNLYKAIGEELINADNDVNDTEMQDYTIYINMLSNYIMQNDKFKQQGSVYTGLHKNTGNNSVDAPVKSGVSAPRKR